MVMEDNDNGNNDDNDDDEREVLDLGTGSPQEERTENGSCMTLRKHQNASKIDV